MKKLLFSTFLLLVLAGVSQAQNHPKTKTKGDVTKTKMADGSKTVTNIGTGATKTKEGHVVSKSKVISLKQRHRML